MKPLHRLKGSLKMFRLLAGAILLLLFIPCSVSCDSDSMELVEVGENPSVFEDYTGNNEANNTADDELKESITEILIDGGHTELLEALEYVNAEIYTQLIELFASQAEQHTLFAPDNEAFFKLYSCLGMKTIDISELGDPGLVRDILLYHVSRGFQDSNSIIPEENGKEINTLYGKALTVKSDRSIHSVGSIANIGPEDADKKAKNGVVHVINEVLLPIELSCQGSGSP